MHFFYDAQSRPAMVEFNGALYSYVHNLQGDIVGIVDSAGSLVVEYKYDTWGKPTLVRTLTTAYEALAELNPFRYRGYVWDNELNLYYLQNRFYSVCWNRFINADNLIQGNLYSYSSNNAINKYDPSGQMDIPTYANAIVGASSAGAAIGGSIGFFIAASVGSIAGLGGLVGGAVAAAAAAAAAAIVAIYAAVAPKTVSEEIESIVDLANDLHLGIDQAYRSAINDSFTPGYAKHHIVPKAAGLADYARAVMEAAGMDPWSEPENKVLLSNQFHQFLHNDFYYIGVDMVMLSVQSYANAHFPGDKEMLKTMVSTALNTMSFYLTVADQAVIRHFS